MDVVSLLAIVFNSDNGGLLLGSIAKALRQRRRVGEREHPPTKEAPAPLSPPSVARADASGRQTPVARPRSILTLASPGKTWVGNAGAVGLGTATAIALGVLLQIRAGNCSTGGPLGSRDAGEWRGDSTSGGLGFPLADIAAPSWGSLSCVLRACGTSDEGVFHSAMPGCAIGQPESDVMLHPALEGLSFGALATMGAAVSAVGVVGDLWESLLKRAAGVKVRTPRQGRTSPPTGCAGMSSGRRAWSQGLVRNDG